MLAFTVLGHPKTQGSMNAFKHPKTGAVIMQHQDPSLKTWRQEVGHACRAILTPNWDKTRLVVVGMEFWFRRPQSHYTKKGIRETELDSGPRYDIDKLERAILDGLTGVAYVDDSQVAFSIKNRCYLESREDEECVVIEIKPWSRTLQPKRPRAPTGLLTDMSQDIAWLQDSPVTNSGLLSAGGFGQTQTNEQSGQRTSAEPGLIS